MEKFEVEKEGVGTLRVVLFKIKEGIWEDLFWNFEDRFVFKAKIWYQLEEVFKDDMEKFYEVHDAYVDMKKMIRKKKNRGKKRKRSRVCRDPFQDFYGVFEVYSKMICEVK